MSTTTLVTSAVTVAALVAAIFEVSQTHRAEAELAALTRDRDGLHAQLRDMQQRATTAEQQGAALQRDLEVARTAKAAVAVAVPAKSFSGPQTPAGNPAIEGRVAFRAIPAGTDPAEARRQVKTLNLENRDYSHLALYRQLGFTPAQHEQFKTLMADYMERGDEQTRAAFAAAMAQSPKPDRAALQPVFEAAAKQNDEEWQAAMRGTFGDAMLQSFQHYRDTIPGREVTKELSSALFYTDNPLTVPQAEQLVEIIAANSRNAQGKVDLAAMNGDAILAQAQAVLSAPQLAALRRAQLQVRQNWAPAGAKPSGG